MPRRRAMVRILESGVIGGEVVKALVLKPRPPFSTSKFYLTVKLPIGNCEPPGLILRWCWTARGSWVPIHFGIKRNEIVNMLGKNVSERPDPQPTCGSSYVSIRTFIRAQPAAKHRSDAL